MKKLHLLLPLLLLVAGCVSKPERKIGLCVISFGADYVQEMCYELRRELAHRGYETVIRDANMQNERQLKQIEAFTEDYRQGKLAALIVMPSSNKTILGALEKAQEAGLPIFTLSTGIAKNEKVKPIANFGLNDAAAGRIAGKMLMAATQNKPGKVLVVSTSQMESCLERVRGLKEELIASHSPIQLVSVECPYTWEEMVNQVFDVLRKDAGTHEIIGIFAPLDPIMIAAMTARNLNGREADVRIVGHGGSGTSRNAVEDGLIFGTVEHSIPDLAALTAQSVVDYLEKGTKLAEEVQVPAQPFTAADAQAHKIQQDRRSAETTAKLEKARQEAAEKNRTDKSAPVKGKETKETSHSELTVKPSSGTLAKKPDGSQAPAEKKEESNVLQSSLKPKPSQDESVPADTQKEATPAAAESVLPDVSVPGSTLPSAGNAELPGVPSLEKDPLLNSPSFPADAPKQIPEPVIEDEAKLSTPAPEGTPVDAGKPADSFETGSAPVTPAAEMPKTADEAAVESAVNDVPTISFSVPESKSAGEPAASAPSSSPVRTETTVPPAETPRNQGEDLILMDAAPRKTVDTEADGAGERPSSMPMPKVDFTEPGTSQSMPVRGPEGK